MFEDRIKTLAFRSDINIKEVSSRQATLTFTFNKDGSKTSRTCFVTAFKEGKYWEFDCISPIEERMLTKDICIYLLKENSSNFRGFWCLEKIGDGRVLAYMHNVASEL